MYTVYVLRNLEGRLYVGQTADILRRVRQHQEGDAGWTRSRGPWELVYTEQFPDRASAVRRERDLKRGRMNQALRRLLREPAVNPSVEGP